jgi:hypothetical protein
MAFLYSHTVHIPVRRCFCSYLTHPDTPHHHEVPCVCEPGLLMLKHSPAARWQGTVRRLNRC